MGFTQCSTGQWSDFFRTPEVPYSHVVWVYSILGMRIEHIWNRVPRKTARSTVNFSQSITIFGPIQFVATEYFDTGFTAESVTDKAVHTNWIAVDWAICTCWTGSWNTWAHVHDAWIVRKMVTGRADVARGVESWKINRRQLPILGDFSKFMAGVFFDQNHGKWALFCCFCEFYGRQARHGRQAKTPLLDILKSCAGAQNWKCVN